MITHKPDIITVLEDQGITLKKRAGQLWACCPLHGEKNLHLKLLGPDSSFTALDAMGTQTLSNKDGNEN